MKFYLRRYSRKFCYSYLFLTFIKFFTARIDCVREEDPTIYFKFIPTLKNVFLYRGETVIEGYSYETIYSWYKNGQYWELFHSPGSMQDIIAILYSVIVGMWWLESLLLIIYALNKLFQGK